MAEGSAAPFHVTPPARVTEWRIHVGAHKTATTHLQHTLAAHRDALLARDRDFIPFKEFRAVAAPYAGGWRRRLWSAPVARGFRRRLDELRRGPGRVMISDEDLLGYSRDLLVDPVYPGPRGLHLLRDLAGQGAPVTLFLGVRCFETILPSAYAQALKAEHFEPGSFARICRRVAEQPPSWLDLVDRLRAALPGAALRVWRHEDYRDHRTQILAGFAGLSASELGPLPDVPPVRGTASPAPEGIARAEGLGPGLEQRARITAVRAIFAEHPAGAEHGRPAPFDATQTERLRSRYAEDLDTLRRRDPDMVMTF